MKKKGKKSLISLLSLTLAMGAFYPSFVFLAGKMVVIEEEIEQLEENSSLSQKLEIPSHLKNRK